MIVRPPLSIADVKELDDWANSGYLEKIYDGQWNIEITKKLHRSDENHFTKYFLASVEHKLGLSGGYAQAYAEDRESLFVLIEVCKSGLENPKFREVLKRMGVKYNTENSGITWFS